MISSDKFSVICYGYNPWSKMWKRNQTMMRTFSARPYVGRALFVNPDVYSANLIREPFKELSRFRRNYWRYVVPRKVANNIEVFTPVVLPWTLRSQRLMDFAYWTTKRVTRSYIESDYILLLNRFVGLSNRIFLQLFEGAFYKVFDWSDDFETFCSSHEQREALAKIRELYLRECDLVITVNDRLTERAKAVNPNSHTIRNATDFECLNKADRPETEVAKVFSKMSGPVVGYMGYLNSDRLDLDLIDYLSVQRPEWQFVFLGPHSHKDPLGADLPRRANIHLLAAVPYADLPRYLKGFDVCIIPNQVNEHTAGNDPIKLYDYLATGRPVVSTATSGTELLSNVIAISDSKESFLHLVDHVLSGGDSEYLKRERIKRAQQNSWRIRFEQVFRLLEEGLLQKRN